MARRPRRAPRAVAAESEAAFAWALENVAGTSLRVARDPGPDLLVTLSDGTTLVFEVKGVAGRAEPGPIANALRSWDTQIRDRRSSEPTKPYGVVVAAAIPDATKAILRNSDWGWLDRRGELDLRVPGLIIHATDVVPLPSDVAVAEKEPIRGRAGITVAACLLLDPGVKRGVREIARAGDLAPSSVSTALADLRSASLLREDGGPLVPDLFWALTDAWKPQREALSLAPSPDVGRRLDLGLTDIDGIGWAVGGTLAAASWSAPVVVGSGAPPDFYVPTEGDVRAARRELHVAKSSQERGCTVAVAPTVLVVRGRHDPHAMATSWLDWPVVHPLFAALDLAQDRARGVEVLADWDPPSPFARVW